jgi:DNA mismatch repair protein MutS
MKVAAEPRLTPVMRQYQEAKLQYPEAIVFFRLGDFYEMFHEDAVLVAGELQLTLTSRDKNVDDPVPMCGVPHHAAAGYVAKLLAKGYRVALCEQMADPATVKGIVPREVVRVLTPALISDPEHLAPRENHHLMAIGAADDLMAGDPATGINVLTAPLQIAIYDLSTGSLREGATQGPLGVLAQLARFEPRELLLVKGMSSELEAAIRSTVTAWRTGLPVLDIAASETAADAGSASVTEALLSYARRCLAGRPTLVSQREALTEPGSVVLEPSTVAHLELVRTLGGEQKGSLLSCIDETVTGMGARLLRQRLLAPLGEREAIAHRLDRVEALVRHETQRERVREALRQCGDVERICSRVFMREATPRELVRLRATLRLLPDLQDALRAASLPNALGTAAMLRSLATLRIRLETSLAEEPAVLLRDGGVLRDEADAELARLRRLAREGEAEMNALELRLREESGIGSLKLRFTRVFGWYVEVTKAQLAKVPKAWHRKQTVAGGERYTTPALVELAETLESASAGALEREASLYAELLVELGAYVESLSALALRLADCDVSAALAELAHRHDYVRPELCDNAVLAIREGRHPVVERMLPSGSFVPNDVVLDETPMWILTGPNMAGKSTLMRQAALIVLMAQMGSFVPAKSATVGLVDRVLSRVGANDNLAAGQSTFMVEMQETANILARATSRSLVIIDEIGRGTSTFDGLAIAWAVAEHLRDVVKCRTLFATHYHELTALADAAGFDSASGTSRGAANWSVAARESDGRMVFLHALQPGPALASYGLAVARMASIPNQVLVRAEEVLAQLTAEQLTGDSLKNAPTPMRAQQLVLQSAPPSAQPQAQGSALHEGVGGHRCQRAATFGGVEQVGRVAASIPLAQPVVHRLTQQRDECRYKLITLGALCGDAAIEHGPRHEGRHTVGRILHEDTTTGAMHLFGSQSAICSQARQYGCDHFASHSSSVPGIRGAEKQQISRRANEVDGGPIV